jgi:hypothetical protein
MADEEIVSGLKKIEDQIVRQREDGSKQTGQLTESISKLRSENNQKSDGIVGTLTSSFEDNASEVAAGFILQSKHHSYLEGKGMDKVDDEVSGLRDDLSGNNTEQKSLLQRIAQWVNPNMQGSKDRERDLENTANTNKQTEFFSNMAKSLRGMVVRPITTTAAGIWTFLKGLAFGGALLAILNFLDGDTWKDWQEWIVTKLPEKIKELKKAFFGEDGGFLKGFTELGKMLGLWSKDADAESPAWKLFKENWGTFLLAIGGLALVFGGPKGLMTLLKAAWVVGKAAATGWLFVGPLIALFTALGKLPGAARTALAAIGGGIKPPTMGTAAGRTFTGPGGQQFRATQVQGPPTQAQAAAGQRPVSVTPVGRPGSGGGASTVTPAIQAKGQIAANPTSAWGKLLGKMEGGGKALRWAAGKLGWLGSGILAYNLHDIWYGDLSEKLNPTQKMTQTVSELGAFSGATLAGGAAFTALLAGVGVAGLSPLLTAIAGSLLVGGATWFVGKNAIQYLAETFFGTGEGPATSWAEKMMAKDKAADEGFGTGGAAQLLGGAGNDTLGAAPRRAPKTTAASLATAISPSINKFGLGGDDLAMTRSPTPITPTPTPDRGSAMTDWSATKSAQAYNGGGAGGGSTNVIAPSNTINNNQSSTTVTSKSLSNPSPLLNAVNFAT